MIAIRGDSLVLASASALTTLSEDAATVTRVPSNSGERNLARRGSVVVRFAGRIRTACDKRAHEWRG